MQKISDIRELSGNDKIDDIIPNVFPSFSELRVTNTISKPIPIPKRNQHVYGYN